MGGDDLDLLDSLQAGLVLVPRKPSEGREPSPARSIPSARGFMMFVARFRFRASRR